MGIRLEVTFKRMPRVEVDDRVISSWIGARLNEARNIFVRNVSRGGGSGRVYDSRRKSGSHRASAPHEFPATDTGRLVNSVDWRMITPHEGSLFSEIDYAEFLTRGTRRMAPRKMLVEAIEEALAGKPRPSGVVRLTTGGGGAGAA